MQKIATKRLGRGLDALLVNVPNELGFVPQIDMKQQQQFQQERAQLLQEAEHLKSLLDTFEQLVLQLEPLKNQTL
ncbi:MAG: hypothetical protein WCL34_11235 [Methylococcaceae bacterium]